MPCSIVSKKFLSDFLAEKIGSRLIFGFILYTVSNGRSLINDEFEKLWKQKVVVFESGMPDI
jgi:hypothetical protein